MQPEDAKQLIDKAVGHGPGVWADLGAGDGTFTRALANILGPGSRIYAVDRERTVLSWAQGGLSMNEVQIIPVVEDFSRPFDVGEESRPLLDGMLFANSLHFVNDPVAVLLRLIPWLRPAGRIVLVEYDRRTSSMWVPHPIAIVDLPTLARNAGLGEATVVASRPSEYGGLLYAAAIDRKG